MTTLKRELRKLFHRNGYQYDRNGKRVRIDGKLTKRGEYYTHHDTCSCKTKGSK